MSNQNIDRNKRVMVKVPASTANLGPGFDSLGMALSLYGWIELGVADATMYELHGDGMDGLPKDKSNLVYKTAQLVFQEAGVSIPELSIKMYSEIPLARGLGSSASTIIGTLVAANALIGSPLSSQRLFNMATALEGHPDNVGASLFGGIVVASWDGESAHYVRLTPPSELDVLVAIPKFHLLTEKARGALPSQLSMGDAVFNIARSSLLTAALASGNLELLQYAMQDRLHQPYRAALIPGMVKILDEACENGALGAALSGAGPTMLAFVDKNSDRKKQLSLFLQETFAAEGIEAELLQLAACTTGPEIFSYQLTETKEADQSFMQRVKGEIKV